MGPARVFPQTRSNSRTEQDQTSQKTKGPHGQARAQSDAAAHRVGHTDHEDSSAATSAEVHKQNCSRWKNVQLWTQCTNQEIAIVLSRGHGTRPHSPTASTIPNPQSAWAQDSSKHIYGSNIPTSFPLLHDNTAHHELINLKAAVPQPPFVC